MLSHKQLTDILKRSMLKAAKLPLVFLLFGIIMIMVANIDDHIPLPELKSFFDLADKIGAIFMALAVLTFIYQLLMYACRRYEVKLNENHPIAALIVSSVRRGLRIILVLATINIIISIVGPTKVYLVLANNILNTAIIASIGWITIQIIYTFEAVIYQDMIKTKQKDHKRSKALYTKVHIMRNIATVIIIFITLAAILMSFSSVRNIGISLLASAGFLTAIIGLAAQKALFSVFSGLQIALSHAIKIGDTVVIDKESGIIEEITFTYVTLKLGDRRRLIVPISNFIDRSFENWSHEANSLRSSILIYVDFMMPIEPLRQELIGILKQSDHWNGEAGKLQVANLNQQSVELRIQVSASNADKLSDLRAEVREKMLRYIQDHYPQYFPIQRTQEQISVDSSG